MPQFHVIVIQLADKPPRRLGPMEALLHARAEHYRNRYRTVLQMVGLQVVLSAFMMVIGCPPKSILIGVLGGTLAITAMSGLAAWKVRKDFLE
jgi:hypothetical protein